MFAARTGWDLTPNRFTLALEQHKKSGSELLDLTASNPTECGLKYESGKIIKSLCSSKTLKYEPLAQGLPAARQAVTDYYQAKSIAVPAENIILTTSTSEAYSYIFRLLCEPGDEVLVPRPSYPLFEFLANIQDVRLVPYSLVHDHGWQIEFNSLQAALGPRTRAIITVNPNNPTGSYIKADELGQLNRLCAAYDLAVISDEVFHDYPLRGSDHLSFASNFSALTFTLSGLSKVAGLPQMKVAWMVVSGPDAQRSQALARLDVIADTYLSMNAPLQHALPAMLESRHAFQRQLNARLKTNLQVLDSLLSKQKTCTRLDVEAGWYAVLRVPVTQSDEDLAIVLLEKHDVLVHPGHFFDFEQEGYLILSLMTVEKDFSEGIKRILQQISSY